VAAAPVTVLALGTRKVGAEVSFDVPAGTESVTIVEQMISAPATATFTDGGVLTNGAAPRTLTTASGAVILDQFAKPDYSVDVALDFSDQAPGTGVIVLPNSTGGLALVSAGLAVGTWRFIVSDLAYLCTLASNCAKNGGSKTSTYDVSVLLKPKAPAAGGKLDLTFNFTSSSSPRLSAASALGDPDMQRMLASLDTMMARGGLSLGTVRFVDVPAAMAARVASGVRLKDATVCGDLGQLFTTAPAGRQVNVFMVSSFIASDQPSGTSIVGIDGSVPGPATISPSLQSGVAVSTVALREGANHCGATLALNCDPSGPGCCGADVTAYVVAHEVGHFLGLFHVTEQYGTMFDSLADTPTCPCKSCTATPSTCDDWVPAPKTSHTMGFDECQASAACAGGDNLMFWIYGAGVVGDVTAEQQRVMHANPAVY